jgi:hypothetical protein
VCAKEIKEIKEIKEKRKQLFFGVGYFFVICFGVSKKKYYFCTLEKFVPKNVVLIYKFIPKSVVLL